MICDAIMARILLHICKIFYSRKREKKKKLVSFMIMIMKMMLMFKWQDWCLFLFRVTGLHCMAVGDKLIMILIP